MAGKPDERPTDEQAADASRAREATERVGVLAVERYVKDDGRALILYAHDRREHA